MRHFARAALCLFLCALIGVLPAPSFSAAAATGTLVLEGVSEDNAGKNNYQRKASPILSYLKEDGNGGYVRASHSIDDGLTVEWFSSSGKRTKRVVAETELPLFGGFFFGEQYNFAVTGDANQEEDPSAEVLRVVRYDLDMNRLDAVSYYGANTTYPFVAGSLRFLEYDGMLWVYSCHEMYADAYGIHHQANMTAVLRESPLKAVDSMFGIANIGYCGYVSHSFNQFIATDGQTLFRADHGDAHMRGVCVTAMNRGDKLGNNVYTVPLAFTGDIGNNTTGATLGGMTVTKNRLLLAGSIDSQTHPYTWFYEDPYQMNVYVLSLDKSLDESETRRVDLTAYPDDADVTVGTPHLVKVADDRVMILWEETADGVTVVKTGLLNEYGVLQDGIHTLEARLSDCAPRLGAEGTVYWYATKDGKSVVYRVDPNRPDSFVPADHNWKTEILEAPTCEQGGLATLTCVVCGKQQKNVALPATGHDWGRWDYVYGSDSHRRVCRNDETHEEWEAHEWEVLSTNRAATCTSSGNGERSCAACGVTETGDIFPPLGHDWGDWTYRTPDEHTRVCGRDAAHTESEAHDWDEGKVLRAATETEDGSIKFTCAVCGGTKTEVIPKIGDAEDFLPGDVDDDGSVTSADARLALRCAVALEKYAPDSRAYRAANVDDDDTVTPADARLILRASVGLETL